MRTAYCKPVIECEVFLANEYVAACSEYLFKCENCGNVTVSVNSDGEATPKVYYAKSPYDGSVIYAFCDSEKDCSGVSNPAGNDLILWSPKKESTDTYSWSSLSSPHYQTQNDNFITANAS